MIILPPNQWDTSYLLANGTSVAELEAVLQKDVHRNAALNYLVAMGHEIRVINPFPWPFNPLEKKNPFLRGLDFVRALYVLLFCRRAECIVSIMDSNAFFILLLRRLFFFKPKVILWDASVDNRWRVLQKIQNVVFPRCDGVMLLVSSQKRSLEARGDCLAPKTLIHYNINEMFFRPKEADNQQREEYVLVVGDDDSRDFATFYRAAAQIAAPVKMKTRWRPVDLPLAANVEFISDFLSPEQFRSLYCSAKIAVLPLRTGNHAGGVTALFEAMAMEKAVVITESYIAADFVEHGQSGLIVPEGDVSAIAAAITELLENEQLRRTLGQNAREVILTRYSTQMLAERISRFVTATANS